MKLWLALVPFAVFLVAFLTGAIVLWFIGKRTKVTQSENRFGKTFHVESPVGMLDVHDEGKLDARLAEIPVYPGALPEKPSAREEVSELRVGGNAWREISTRYWTPDSAKQVWDFYRQQLPEWPQNLDGAQGRELIHRRPDCVMLIRVTGQQDRTSIEMCIKPVGYPHLFSGRGYR